MIIENKKAAVKVLISPVIDQWPAVISSAEYLHDLLQPNI